MHILIAGGCGFIGTNLVKYLTDRGYHIRILDNLSVGTEENLRKIQSQYSLPPSINLIIGDIRNEEVVTQTVRGVDGVVHLAAQTSVIDSLENPKETWDINVLGTINLLEACRQNGVAKFIFASSNAVVGEQLPPIDEQKTPRPLSPYGASKLAGEALCSAYYHSFNLETVSLRFANCFGPYSRHKSSVIARFFNLVKEGKPIIIYGDGNQTRDFIYVDDVCQAIYLSLANQDTRTPTLNPYGEVFQIASGTETTVNALAKMVMMLTEKEVSIVYEPGRKGEIIRNYSDISKARAFLGFEPKVKLEEGLYNLSQWYSEVIN